MIRKNKNGGFIELILLVILGLILLKYFLNFSIFEAADSPEGQSTIGYIGQVFEMVWALIASPVIFVWEEVVLPLLKLFWQTFQAFLSWGQSNVSTTGN